MEKNVLFSDSLSTFYVWLYDILHTVKDHSAKENSDCRHIMGYCL